MKLVKRRLGDLLLEAGLISPEQLARALQVKESTGGRLGEIVVDLGFVTETDVAQLLAQQCGYPFLGSSEVRLDPAAARLISEQAARRYRAVPIARRENRLSVAVSDPLNVFAVDDIGFMTGLGVDPVVVTSKTIEQLLEQAYEVPAIQEAAAARGTRTEGAPEPARPGTHRRWVRPEERAATWAEAEGAPIIRLGNTILERALAERASDVHVEPAPAELRIRFRVDGVLRDAMTASLDVHASLISRLKLLGGLDISERRVPQDGHFRMADKYPEVDFRVSTLPTIRGEKAVVRILDKRQAITRLEELGMGGDDLETFRRLVAAPYGMLLVTGPTGSGKSTSLMATLGELNDPSKHIVTIEDPVEYEIPGIVQTQVNERAGYTFAAGLRSLLRQDPNVVMVGEIRDPETAASATRLALTGHLVLSTVHTNSAAGTVARLLDMGVEPFLLSGALIGVVSQRLVRVLCTRCREAYEAPDQDPDRVAVGLKGGGPVTLYRARGCANCSQSGYFGRTGIFEVLVVTPAIRSQINARRSTADIHGEAVRGGMRPLLQDGVAKALRGITCLDELRRAAFRED